MRPVTRHAVAAVRQLLWTLLDLLPDTDPAVDNRDLETPVEIHVVGDMDPPHWYRPALDTLIRHPTTDDPFTVWWDTNPGDSVLMFDPYNSADTRRHQEDQ